MVNKYYVYLHKFKNGTYYVGKGSNNRIVCFSKRNKYWKILAEKYGMPIVGIYRENLTEKESFELEITLIALFKYAKIKLCNLTNGGEGTAGHNIGVPMKESTKQKLRECNIGKTLSAEHKEKIKLYNLGQKRSEEARGNMRQAQLGTKQSEETKLKRSGFNNVRSKPVNIYTSEGVLLAENTTISIWCSLNPEYIVGSLRATANTPKIKQYKGIYAKYINK